MTDSRPVTPLVRHDVDAGVATLTLARPKAGNAMNMDFMDALHEAVTAVVGDPGTRAILIEAEGDHFCVGGDVKDFADETDSGRYMADLAGRLHVSIRLLAAHPAPVVAAVRGVAAGAGLSLVAGADVAIAGRSANFLMAYGALGLTADGGASWSLPRTIGLRRTQEMAFLGRRLTAEEAERSGLVTRVVKDHRVTAEARDAARRIADGPTAAFGAVKALLARSGGATLSDQLDAECAAIAAARVGDDAREGVAAFMTRRKPRFTGR